MPIRFSSLWRHADFMRLWAGQSVSVIGTSVTWVALPFTAALTLDATPFQMGLLVFLEGVPALFGLFAGVLVDRLRRRPVMIITNVLRFALLLVVPVAAYFRVLHIELLYIVAFLLGVGTLFFDVAYNAYFPTLIGREHVVEANSRLQATDAGAGIIGPSIAGLLVQLLTAPFALVVDALSYLVSVASLLTIRTHESKLAIRTGRQSVRREIAEGMRTLMGNPLLRSITLYQVTTGFFWKIRLALIVLFATHELAIGPALFGVINSVGSVGFLAGAVLANRIAQRAGPGPTIIGATLITGLSVLLIPLAQLPIPFAVAMLLMAQIGSTGATAVYTVNQSSLRQIVVPDRVMGRVFASWRFITWGTSPLGALLGGILGSVIGLRGALLVAAIGQLAAVGWVLFSPLRDLRTQPAPVEEPYPAPFPIRRISGSYAPQYRQR